MKVAAPRNSQSYSTVVELLVVIVPVNTTGLVCAQEVKVMFLPTESPIATCETVSTTTVNAGVAVGITVRMVKRVEETVKVIEGSDAEVSASVPF